MRPKILTPNLFIVSVRENHFKGAELISVECTFEFFRQTGTALVSVQRIDNAFASYGLTEIDEELSDSFNELLEEHWSDVVNSVKAFIKKWNKKNAS